ncbi:type I iodothyronine deiodinase-like [Lytechinus variegatus]|uniref:type I iodothyronine deiodinase-like n=1 Tax=Lytechinus variegatus TaxID=7654 RepID=UPI001BB21E24|nr:type I iodothyronine deiodinase-like [Lytechinus variegatus]
MVLGKTRYLQACVIGGTLADIVRDYRTQVDFLAVYLAEAHAKGQWPLGSNNSYTKEHKSLQERIAAAKDLLKIDAETYNCMTDDIADVSKFRIVVDQMDNLFSRMFNAYPDRVVFIREGKIVYFGKNILGQMQDPSRLMTHEAREWLEENVGSDFM